MERLLAKIEELIAVNRTATMPPDMRWIGAEEAAAMLGFAPRYFAENVSKRPIFPQPLRVDGTGNPRWNMAEVDAWARQHRAQHAPEVDL